MLRQLKDEHHQENKKHKTLKAQERQELQKLREQKVETLGEVTEAWDMIKKVTDIKWRREREVQEKEAEMPALDWRLANLRRQECQLLAKMDQLTPAVHLAEQQYTTLQEQVTRHERQLLLLQEELNVLVLEYDDEVETQERERVQHATLQVTRRGEWLQYDAEMKAHEVARGQAEMAATAAHKERMDALAKEALEVETQRKDREQVEAEAIAAHDQRMDALARESVELETHRQQRDQIEAAANAAHDQRMDALARESAELETHRRQRDQIEAAANAAHNQRLDAIAMEASGAERVVNFVHRRASNEGRGGVIEECETGQQHTLAAFDFTQYDDQVQPPPDYDYNDALSEPELLQTDDTSTPPSHSPFSSAALDYTMTPPTSPLHDSASTASTPQDTSADTTSTDLHSPQATEADITTGAHPRSPVTTPSLRRSTRPKVQSEKAIESAKDTKRTKPKAPRALPHVKRRKPNGEGPTSIYATARPWAASPAKDAADLSTAKQQQSLSTPYIRKPRPVLMSKNARITAPLPAPLARSPGHQQRVKNKAAAWDEYNEIAALDRTPYVATPSTLTYRKELLSRKYGLEDAYCPSETDDDSGSEGFGSDADEEEEPRVVEQSDSITVKPRASGATAVSSFKIKMTLSRWKVEAKDNRDKRRKEGKYASAVVKE
jgi:hypothetical protein